MLIVDFVTDELRDRVKTARPELVWGLLLGKRDGVDRVLQAMHLANTSAIPSSSININYSLISTHLEAIQQDECEVVGYYYSCTEKTVAPIIIDSLPFPSTYYVVRLVTTPTQFRWETERVDKVTGNRVPESLKKGSLQKIEQQVAKQLQPHPRSQSLEQTEKPLTLIQRFIAFVSKLYSRWLRDVEPLQEREIRDADPTPQQVVEVIQPTELPSSSIVAAETVTKPTELQKPLPRPIRTEVPQIDRSVLTRYHLRYLYHMTHRANLESILQRGLLSHNTAHQYGYVSRDIANSDVVYRRGWRRDNIHHRPINEYAPLYFNPRNPMLYAKKEIQDDIIILGFDPILLFNRGVIFTDGNAAATDTRFYHRANDLERINWNCIYGNSWTDIPDGRRIKCAEVLVYPSISTEYLNTIFCRNHQMLRLVQPLLTNHPNIRLATDHSLYF